MSELLKKLETETCSRCGGSGHFSYCQMWGTICFRCKGKKITYTKRGAAAALYLESLRKKPASEFKVGELFYQEGLPGFYKGGFHTITSIRVHSAAEKVAKGFKSMTNGIEVPQRDSLILEAEGTSWEGGPECLIRKGCTAEEKAATFKQALEYQATLTKMGKPAKRPAKEPGLFEKGA